MKRILIVDDNADDRIILVALLEHFGYEVLEASNAFAALGIAENQRPDLIISDLHMPGLSGFDLARQVRRSPDLKYVPFFILSAFCDRYPQSQFHDAGITGCHVKPVTPSKLRQLVSEILA